MTEHAERRYCANCEASNSEDAAFCEVCGTQLSDVAPGGTPLAAAGDDVRADFGYRLAAYIIDGILVTFLQFASLILVAMDTSAGVLLTLALFPGYFWIGNGLGGTPGKRLIGLRVVGADGRPPGLGRGLVRYLVSIISAIPFYLGYLWVLWDGEKQAWHDKAAGTFVVRRIAAR